MDEKTTSIAAALVDPENHRNTAKEETDPIRDYMAREGVQQYRDYYEDDPQEQAFFEYLDNLPNRDRIRFMEVFEDFTVARPQSGVAMIPKREFNPELSVFSNLLLQLIRVQPTTLVLPIKVLQKMDMGTFFAVVQVTCAMLILKQKCLYGHNQ